MKKLLPVFILMFASFAAAQSELPEIGTLADVRGLTKVYVATEEGRDRKWILKEFKKYKQLEIVNRPQDAQLFMEYRTPDKAVYSGLTSTSTYTGQMNVYIS